MCIEPVRIISSKLRAGTYICGADRISMDVPCGHCHECNQKKVNDLVFRCYHEYLDCDLHDGFTLFQTLTYSLENSPFSGGFRFFKKDDLQKFLKRIRKKLSNLGYDHEDGKLKYIITCEYGSDPKHMHLPHYHVCFFSKVPMLDPSVLDRVIHDSWKYLGDNFTDSCELGFVDRRDTGLRVVNSIYGIRYVCKYVFKGTSVKDALDYNKSSHITQFVKSFCVKYGKRFGSGKHEWKYDNLYDWQIARIWKCYKAYFPTIEGFELMPFTLQSKGLGMSFLENSSIDELMDVVQLPSKSPTGFQSFSVPMYYIRKAFYNYDKVSKRFILNEFGKEFRQKVSCDMVEDYKEMFQLNRDLLDNVSRRLFGVDYTTLVNTALSGRSIDEFIHYAVYLKDRQVPQHLHFLLEGFDLSKDVDIIEYCKEFYSNALDQQIADSPNWCIERFRKFKLDFLPDNTVSEYVDSVSGDPSDLRKKKIVQISLPLHNVLPCFRGYDELYNKLQKIKYEFSLARNLKLDDDYKSDKSVALARSIINPQNSIIY